MEIPNSLWGILPTLFTNEYFIISHVELHDDILTSNYKYVFLTPLVRRMSHLHHYLLGCEPKSQHDQLSVHSLFLSLGTIKISSAIVSIANYIISMFSSKKHLFCCCCCWFFMYKATDKSVNRKSTPCSFVWKLTLGCISNK